MTMERLPHAALDATGRYAKAAKIHRLLGIDQAEPHELRLLEVGTGAGVIASYFAHLSTPRFRVDAVDTVDQRQLADGYAFRLVNDASLPFENAGFDLVVSNHVIEHVGDAASQLLHLKEIARVLKPDGRVYLAVPSRWQIVEPHYRLAWLSWLPPAWRSSYVRLRRAGTHYDCRPLSRGQLESMLTEAGLAYRNLLPQALDAFVRQEGAASWAARFALRLPRAMLQKLASCSPTHIYLLHHMTAEAP